MTDVNTGAPIISGASYYIRPVHAPTKGLDVSGGSTANGANVLTWAKGSAANQQWYVRWKPAEGGYYYISTCMAKDKKMLDVSGGTAANGANVDIWDYNGLPGQQWFLQPSSSYKNGFVVQSAQNRNYVLDIANASVADGANVQVYQNNGSGAQAFYFDRVRSAPTLKHISTTTVCSTTTITFDSTMAGSYYYVMDKTPADQFQMIDSKMNKTALKAGQNTFVTNVTGKHRIYFCGQENGAGEPSNNLIYVDINVPATHTHPVIADVDAGCSVNYATQDVEHGKDSKEIVVDALSGYELDAISVNGGAPQKLPAHTKTYKHQFNSVTEAQNLTVTSVLAQTYTVTIPAEVTFTENDYSAINKDIVASDVYIAPGKAIEVGLATADINGNAVISNGQDYIGYNVGGMDTYDGAKWVSWFYKDGILPIICRINSGEWNKAITAGNYTGSLVFTVGLV
jgi:hypothetical protein